MDRAGEYEAQALMNKSQTYQNLAMFLNRGRRISIDSIESKPKMQRIVEEVCEAAKQWVCFAEQSDIPESKSREDFVNFHFVF